MHVVEQPTEEEEKEELFSKSLEMDSHLRSQMTFVFFCCSSFVMLIVYIALDDRKTGSSLQLPTLYLDKKILNWLDTYIRTFNRLKIRA